MTSTGQRRADAVAHQGRSPDFTRLGAQQTEVSGKSRIARTIRPMTVGEDG